MILSGLVALTASADQTEGEEALRVLLVSVTATDKQVPVPRWTQGQVCNIIELHAAFRIGQVGPYTIIAPPSVLLMVQLRDADLALIMTDATIPISRMIPIASVQTPFSESTLLISPALLYSADGGFRYRTLEVVVVLAS